MTADEMRSSDWSSDVCSSDLLRALVGHEDDVIVTIERRAFAIGPTLDDHHASGHAEVEKQHLAVIELQQHVLGPALDALHPAPLEARREVLRQREAQVRTALRDPLQTPALQLGAQAANHGRDC